jgi:hypothetical protein
VGGRSSESKLQSGVALMASRSSSSHLCSVLCSVSQHCERVFCVSFSHSSMGVGTTWIFFFLAAYLATVFVFVDMKG